MLGRPAIGFLERTLAGILPSFTRDKMLAIPTSLINLFKDSLAILFYKFLEAILADPQQNILCLNHKNGAV
jgi:hypothetical protein